MKENFYLALKTSCRVLIFQKHILLSYQNYQKKKKINDTVLPKMKSGTGSRIILEAQVHTFQTLPIH